MAILTHGSDLGLAPTIRPVVMQSDGTVQTALDHLAKARFRSVQLDATLAGIRPRDLDARSRKDLAALMMRRGLTLAGLDLFLPRRHYAESENLDRAMTATLAAISLAADLGRVPLSMSLPVTTMADDSKQALVEAADAHGIRLAIHAEDALDELVKWMEAVDLPALGAGLDPAAALVHSLDPAAVVHGLKRRLAVARLSDASGTSVASTDGAGAAGLRSGVGAGDLDIVGYRVALDLAPGRAGPVVLDLRGMENPLAAAALAKEAWEKAAFTA
jgi:sugar phosphate isomerase/epimerase